MNGISARIGVFVHTPKSHIKINDRNLLLISSLVLIWSVRAASQMFDFQNQVSAWMTFSGQQTIPDQMGVRYLAGLSWEKSLTGGFKISSEVSFNAYRSMEFQQWDDVTGTGQIKPYRLWFRLTSAQFEARIGLQKINFGSAAMLRPLMWFDRIDPRDPLQLTDGVYGLLIRYYFLNNANIWLWGLYGNNDLKGWEFIPSHPHKIESGGRMQIPVHRGELALTLHHRQIDLKKGFPGQLLSGCGSVPENRLGLDGKWDLGIGLWLEGVLVHQDLAIDKMHYQRLSNVGLDYTFGLGNGLHISAEAFMLEMAEQVFNAGERFSFSILALNYPLGLLDRLTSILYFDREHENWYRFISYQRTWDHWQFYLIGFWNPSDSKLYQNREDHFYAGKGIQLMIVFNH